MKKAKTSKLFLEELEKLPIIQVACERTGISRNTLYRWQKEDLEFAKDVQKALREGVSFINDMSESVLLTLIKDKDFRAVSFWLKSRHPSYKPRIDVEKQEDPAVIQAAVKELKAGILRAQENFNVTEDKSKEKRKIFIIKKNYPNG